MKKAVKFIYVFILSIIVLSYHGNIKAFARYEKEDNNYKKPEFIYEKAFLADDNLQILREVSMEETKNTTCLPVLEYKIKVGIKKNVKLMFEGSFTEGERYAVGVLDKYKGIFEETFISNELRKNDKLSFSVNCEKYKDYDNCITLRIYPKMVQNSSNTFLWMTDTQYYSRLITQHRGFYEKMAEYTADLYKNNKIAYAVHTGDVVNIPNFRAQYRYADYCQGIIDSAGVPNGILAGNHDVGHDPLTVDYSMFQEYFGKHRYEKNIWFGDDSYDDNSLSYQLITMGDSDYIFLLLGYGRENQDTVIEKANEILRRYKHRTAVIATHAYIKPNGEYDNDRALDILEKIVYPNENVRLVICGHHDAAYRKEIRFGDRKIIELLADYQSLLPHKNYGGAFLRLISLGEGKLISRAYSPYSQRNNYYSYDEDNFMMDFETVQKDRNLYGSLIEYK